MMIVRASEGATARCRVLRTSGLDRGPGLFACGPRCVSGPSASRRSPHL